MCNSGWLLFHPQCIWLVKLSLSKTFFSVRNDRVEAYFCNVWLTRFIAPLHLLTTYAECTLQCTQMDRSNGVPIIRPTVSSNTVPCKKTGLFGVFHTKYIHTTRVENHLKVMLNPPFFSQLLALMWKASPWVLVAKFSVVLEIRAVKFLIFIFPY